ncbi:MAG TPA: type II toxin-antitoxin system RelE/ParE family toxin, partial [Actinomycetota bacterium]|nr:type II toxin-antitoxin system RelE/ParE family toxin [Actinomycetota bacterium]
MTSLIYSPEATAEVRAIHDWYERESAGLGRALLEDLRIAEEAIARSPFAFRVIRRETRRYLLARFPYQLLFTVRKDTVVIVACLHA